MENNEKKMQENRENKTAADNKAEKHGSLKSSAKAAGLKSVFQISENTLLMTSFGKGNEAILEKKIEEKKIESIRSDENAAFSATAGNKRFLIAGRVNGTTDNPLETREQTGMDLIGAKPLLEKQYFGKEFPEDSIHIQAIYAIQDIHKILAVYANNLVYSLNNLFRYSENEDTDFIGAGYISLQNTYEYHKSCAEAVKKPDTLDDKRWRVLKNSWAEFQEFVKSPRLAYYGNAFYQNKKTGTGKASRANGRNKKEAEWEKRPEEEIFYIIGLISLLRQSSFHGKEELKDSVKDGMQSTMIFRLDRLSLRNGRDKALQILDKIYEEKIRSLDSFTENSAKNNFALLFQTLPAETAQEKSRIAQDFYRFSILKENKNTGFSIRKLREKLIDNYMNSYKDLSYDAVRPKLNQLFDFLIWISYQDASQDIEELQGKLRAARSETEKERIYEEEAASLYKTIGRRLHSIGGKIKSIGKGTSYALPEEDKLLVQEAIERVQISTKASHFSKLIYLMTLFLDGKEINDLLTTLIHAFENIDSFIHVMESTGMDCNFLDEYAFFRDSGKVATELRTINSIARMTKELFSGKLPMFQDAARILGTKQQAEELDSFLQDEILDKQKLRRLPNGKADTGFRNFIINNVTESRRFRYLVRYGNPEKLRAFMECQPLVKFVLNELPDAHLARYYKGCYDTDTAVDRRRMVDGLADRLIKMRFDDFKNVKQRANAAKNRDKQKQQALISLYLYVLYQIVKNLVYANARYTMAFYCLERDHFLFYSQNPEDYKNIVKDGYKELAKDSIGKREAAIEDIRNTMNQHPGLSGRDRWLLFERKIRAKDRVKDYLDANLGNLSENDTEVRREYRNLVDHLSAIRNGNEYIHELKNVSSWFGVYHFLAQRVLKQKLEGKRKFDKSPKNFQAYLKATEKYHSYCKDCVKVLNAPFSYNLARYKNLSIEGLFDKNRPQSDACNDIKTNCSLPA